MFALGIEEPATNNQSLLIFDIDTDSVRRDESAGLGINRYTFVLLEGECECLPKLIDIILMSLKRKAYAALAWPNPANMKSGSIRTKALKHIREKSGARVLVANESMLAIKDIAPPVEWPIFERSPLDGGWVLMASDFEDIPNVLFERAQRMSDSRRFFPDEELLKKISISDLVLFYGTEDNCERPAIIVVCKHRLDSAIFDSTNVFDTRRGPQASAVLNLGFNPTKKVTPTLVKK